ncbi:PQQ-binding-like beta-propeller repeat protein, partial [bacterium]|nr:PQQ-binding-like beta-propeller repeat protein [bacterium]MBU1635993.1 PQQ-binding-like beta-propeller repeat protein [bacterium]
METKKMRNFELIGLLIFIISFSVCCNIFDSHNEDPEEVQLDLLWNYPYEYEGWGPELTPTAIFDSLVVMTGDHNITCLFTGSGEVKWTIKVTDEGSSVLQDIKYDNTQVYGYELYTGIFALDINTGLKNWEYGISDRDRFDRFYDISSTNYYLGTYDDTSSYIWSFTKNGGLNYKKQLNNKIWGIRYYNGKIYCSSGWWTLGPREHGQITCYEADTGDSLWSYYVADKGGFYRVPPIIEDGILYCGTVYGDPKAIVVALDAETGEEIWQFSHEGEYAEFHDIKLADGVLYCSTQN